MTSGQTTFKAYDSTMKTNAWRAWVEAADGGSRSPS